MIKSLIALIVIPVIGYLVSLGILNSLAEDKSISEFVEFVKFNCQSGINICDMLEKVILLRDSSFYSFIFSFFIIFSFFLVSKLIGTNRNLIARVFPPLVHLVLIMVSIQTIVQGVILTYGFYIGEVFFFGMVHFILIGMIAFISGATALLIILSIFSLSKKSVHEQIGQQLLSSDHPKIWEFVKSIADNIGAEAPNNIIVGINPTFYATVADIIGCGYQRLKGETLYLSLPLMRLFSLTELKAVIGHELGHFKAKDTAYSTKFAPIYRGLEDSINSLKNPEEDEFKIYTPAFYLISYMYESFAENVATISREREFEADTVAVSVSSPEDLAISLTKVVLFSSIWTTTREENIRRLIVGKYSPNLSLVFKDSAAYSFSKQTVEDAKKSVLNSSIAHPTDSHPLLKDRLINIGLKPEDLRIENILNQGDSCSDLIENLELIEEELTVIEHRMMHRLLVASGHAVLPDENEGKRRGVEYIYSMAAAMIGVDGKIEQEEVATAESIGLELVDSFDKIDFRAFINNLDSIPNIIDLANSLNHINKADKDRILSYLELIAKSDGEVSEEESRLLDEIRIVWD